jgi:hypothetical protein
MVGRASAQLLFRRAAAILVVEDEFLVRLATAAHLGLSPAENMVRSFIPARHKTRVHPFDRPEWIEKVQAALGPNGDGLLNAEYRTNPEKESVRWVHVRGRLVSAPGEGQRFMGTVRDASAEKEAEEHRKLLTHELEHLIKNMMAVVLAIVNQTLRHSASPQEARDSWRNPRGVLGLKIDWKGRGDTNVDKQACDATC